MKKITNSTFVIGTILLSTFFMPFMLFTLDIDLGSNEDPRDLPTTMNESVVNGFELYSEQMQFILAGDTCLIRQSAITEDKYIISHVPLDDLAFKNASLIIIISNGIYPANYIDAFSASYEQVSFQFPANGFSAYLSYGITDNNKIQNRKDAAKDILEAAFEIELFEKTTPETTTFSFYGVLPDLPAALETFTSQVPDDGYFNHLDKERLTAPSYYNNHHLSMGTASIDPWGGDVDGFDSLGAVSDILDLLSLNASEISEFLGLNFTDNGSEEILNDKTTINFAQYEGNALGVSKTGSNTYRFDMKAALGLEVTDEITPSRAVWNSLIDLNPLGIFSTMIDVNVITGDIHDWTFNTVNLTIDDYILDMIYLASGLFGNDIDVISTLRALEYVIENVSISTHWENTGASTQLFSNVNLSQEAVDDYLNTILFFLPDALVNNFSFADSPLNLFGFTGLPYIPTGLLKPIPDVIVDYTIDASLNYPNLHVRQQSSGPIQEFQDNIPLVLNITNIGDETAYGVKLAEAKADISQLTGGIIPNAVIVPYEIRGFHIPAFTSLNVFDSFYGSENFLINISKTSGLVYSLLGLADLSGNGDGYADFLELGVISSSQPMNILEPGQSIIIDESDASLSGLYSTFDGEVANFTTSTLLNGSSTGNSSINNDTLAGTVDLNYWEVETTGSGTNNNITIEFTFQKETSNLTTTDIDAIRFNFVGYTNVSLWDNGIGDFYIQNNNTGEWIPVNNLTRADNNVTINQTASDFFAWDDTFTIYNGENDTTNTTINITDYLSGPNNNRVALQIRFNNNQSTLMSIDYMGMDYLEKNFTTYLVLPKTVSYTNITGKQSMKATSNSLYVGSYNTSALEVNQHLSSFKSTPGNVITYTVEITNRGTELARNVNISIPIPGIITDTMNFTLDDNSLENFTTTLAVNESITRQFQFSIPNSLLIPGAIVRYDNDTTMNATRADFTIRANGNHIKAPVDFSAPAYMPHLIQVNTSMVLDNPGTTPQLNDEFNVTLVVNVTNKPTSMTSIHVTIPITQLFSISGSENVTITLAGSSGTAGKTIQKISLDGYLLPPLNVGDNDMDSAMRHVPQQPMPLGTMAFTLNKVIMKSNGEVMGATFSIKRNDELVVNVTMVNTGNLPIGIAENLDPNMQQGFIIEDRYGFNQSGFISLTGGLSKANITLNPGENVSFSYLLVARRVGKYELGSIAKEYYFLRRIVVKSQSYSVTIKEKPGLVAAYLGLSLGITALLAIISIMTKKKQKRAYDEFKRTDKVLYGTIKETEETYAEYLD
ncbi:MAG: hypothetical protein ACTSUE_16915 [Promethearchaeota archaeon]